jgi:hypothetical protein
VINVGLSAGVGGWRAFGHDSTCIFQKTVFFMRISKRLPRACPGEVITLKCIEM